jgi:hypothetical protein
LTEATADTITEEKQKYMSINIDEEKPLKASGVG